MVSGEGKKASCGVTMLKRIYQQFLATLFYVILLSGILLALDLVAHAPKGSVAVTKR
jgi:hypothetical protein